MQVENSLGVMVEPTTRLGKGNPASSPVEERDAQLLFKNGDSLADGCLGEAQVGCYGGKAPPLGGSHEGREMGKFRVTSVW